LRGSPCDDDEEQLPDVRPSHPSASVLQLRKSKFTILSESLSRLQPGIWLNDEIVVGALLLLEEVSNNKVRVVDSVAKTAPRINFHKTKVLLPMLIYDNHWVLGVYEDSKGLVVYDSDPKQTTVAEARKRLAEVFQKKDIRVTLTAPLLQTNADDCGILAIVAAFYETIGVGIEPTEIDPNFWRDILRQLLSPQSEVEHVPNEPQIDLSGLPANARLSEVPGILSQCLRQPLDATKRKLASAEHALKMICRAREGATKAGLSDIIARFRRVEDYCAAEAGHCRSELELGQCIDRLPKVCKTQ